MAALGCFWHPQIMPDFPSPKICIKPYESRSRRLIKTSLLPTLKPEEPEILSATKPPLTEHCNIQYGAGLWRCSCD
jgi:hypothetical protein